MMASNSTAHTGNSLSRIVVASTAGSAIEWYDFFVCGTAAALVLNPCYQSAMWPGR